MVTVPVPAAAAAVAAALAVVVVAVTAVVEVAAAPDLPERHMVWPTTQVQRARMAGMAPLP